MELRHDSSFGYASQKLLARPPLIFRRVGFGGVFSSVREANRMRVVNHHAQRQLQLLADQELRSDIAKRSRTHRAGEAKLQGIGELLRARASVGV